jgi:hypothetical protein
MSYAFPYSVPRPMINCTDGFRMSVQASVSHYCEPRDNQGPYESAEVGYPSKEEPLLAPYAEDPSQLTQTVYGWVPMHVIEEVIAKHGGAVEGYTWDQPGLPRSMKVI